MSDPYVGEMRLIGYSFPPKGWAYCNGQLLPINQNQALFSLLGTTYGGDGQRTFALPDLQGRAPIHFNSTYPQGNSGGETSHTLTQNEMPAHVHSGGCSNTGGNAVSPAGAVSAVSAETPYSTAAPDGTMASPVSNVGGSQPHENRQPYLALGMVIALVGIFPSRN